MAEPTAMAPLETVWPVIGMRKIGRRKRLCPFVGQDELVTRMRTDQIQLRAGLRIVFASRDDERAAERVDAWISRVITELGNRKATLGELQVIVDEWQRRRAPFLAPEPADVIVVDT